MARAAAAGTVFTSTPSRYTCTTDRAGARTLSVTLLPTTLDEAGDDAAARTSAGSCEPIFGLVKRFEPGSGAVARAKRGTIVVGAGAVVVGTVVVGAGTVVVGTVVAGASGASPPESPLPPSSPPPESPPPPGALGFVVEVGGTVVAGGTVVEGEEACGGLALTGADC